MAGKLKHEIRQTRDFSSLEEEAVLNIARTGEYLMSAFSDLMKQESLTLTQYNALRILRGAGDAGRMCGEIGERMISKESDITRLLDRLETRGLISRERPANNRRAVITKITHDGAGLLARLDKPVADLNIELAGKLKKKELKSLIEMLESLREK